MPNDNKMVKAFIFKRMEGPVFVVLKDNGNVAQAVFKTGQAAKRFCKLNPALSLHLGVFVSDDEIRLI